MTHQLGIIKDRINNELKRARIAGVGAKRSQIDVRDEIIDLTSTLKKIYIEKALDLQLNIEPETFLAVDRQDFLELIGNLLDNAFKWAKHNIHVRVQTTGNFQLTLEDDGLGCKPAELQLITQRGKKLDENKTGHGLGLSIAQDIVAQYNGEIQFSKSLLGGLLVEITFPLDYK